jgi:hypothetical protein
MVTRVNGGPQQGFWFSKDVRVLTITTDLSDWLADLLPAPAGVNSGLEQVLEAVSQYGTVIGVTAIDDDTLHVMVDYANQFVAGNSLAADINAIATPNFANTTVDTFDGFAGAVNGTPA